MKGFNQSDVSKVLMVQEPGRICSIGFKFLNSDSTDKQINYYCFTNSDEKRFLIMC